MLLFPVGMQVLRWHEVEMAQSNLVGKANVGDYQSQLFKIRISRSVALTRSWKLSMVSVSYIFARIRWLIKNTVTNFTIWGSSMFRAESWPWVRLLPPSIWVVVFMEEVILEFGTNCGALLN